MTDKHKVLLIGGSSHVGKSTLAQSLANHFAWSYCSTDKLARHPGRPWQNKGQEVSNHIADHYLLSSADELIADVLRHYRECVWPLIENIATAHSLDTSANTLVIEGSAILPELAAASGFDSIGATWLTASNKLFERRIYTASQYETKSARDKRMIDKFLARTLLYNEQMMASVNRLGLMSVDVEKTGFPISPMTRKCLDELFPNSWLHSVRL